MKVQSVLPTPILAGATGFLLDAMRSWRWAKDKGHAVQPPMYAQLSCHGQGMLAPVIDGLMSLFETALGRRVDVGSDGGISPDEDLLLSLLACSRNCRACFRCSNDLALTLDYALCSARLMMALAERRNDVTR